MVLTPLQARKFYDRFGEKQDTQAFYEDAALDDLIVHGDFRRATSLFEFGCGTGRFASHLLTRHLPLSATYYGIDISNTMIQIASERIKPYGERAKVTLSEGSMAFPLPDQSVDLVVSTYVFDLLSQTDIENALSEARRVLTAEGKLCLVSLTQGEAIASKLISSLWSGIFHMHAPLVGGCRPIRLEPIIRQQSWTIEYRNLVTRFAVPSEVLIARPPNLANRTAEIL